MKPNTNGAHMWRVHFLQDGQSKSLTARADSYEEAVQWATFLLGTAPVLMEKLK